MKQLEMSNAEFEQITCDIENAIAEFRDLSKEVEWFVTDVDERLETCLVILRRAV